MLTVLGGPDKRLEAPHKVRHDATHLAVMQSYGTHDVATIDADFLDVGNLTLWLPVAECLKLRNRA